MSQFIHFIARPAKTTTTTTTHQHHPSPSSPHRPPPSDYQTSIQSNPSSSSNLQQQPTSIPFNPAILTRADLNDSLNTLSNLINTSKAYRLALINLSDQTSSFAKALEDCARLKGTTQSNSQHPSSIAHHPQHHSQNQIHHHHHQPSPSLESNHGSIETDSTTPHNYDQSTSIQNLNAAERLLAASGLHFITANLEQVLSNTFQGSFEIPLMKLYNEYQRELTNQQMSYDKLVSIKTKEIRDTELRNMNQGGSRHSRNAPRDLDSFRRGLRDLQDQVERLENLKQSYYLQLAHREHQIWNQVAENISLVVKSEVEVYDRIASKPISDPTLESMVSSIPDPFDTYKPVHSIDPSTSDQPEIYSILDPLSSLLTGTPTKLRKSIDLAQSLSSLDNQSPHPHPGLVELESSDSIPRSLLSSFDHHPHLNSTTHWARSSVDLDSSSAKLNQQTTPKPCFPNPQIPHPTGSGSYSMIHDGHSPSRPPHNSIQNHISLPSATESSRTITSPPQPTSHHSSLNRPSKLDDHPHSSSSSSFPSTSSSSLLPLNKELKGYNSLLSKSDHDPIHQTERQSSISTEDSNLEYKSRINSKEAIIKEERRMNGDEHHHQILEEDRPSNQKIKHVDDDEIVEEDERRSNKQYMNRIDHSLEILNSISHSNQSSILLLNNHNNQEQGSLPVPNSNGEEVLSLLGERPPSGLELSDSEL